MAGNETLSARNRAALDEWYTQLPDIELELRHYREQFKGKVVFCNCDDPYESNFFKYFAMNFNHLGLKRLITTCYAGSPISGEQLALFETAGLKNTPPPREPYKVVISNVPDLNEDGAIDLTDVEHLLRNDANVMTPLEGGGDFRSKECVALLKEADIVVTNPPFSLFREYINLLINHGKQFLEIKTESRKKVVDGFKYQSMGRIYWYTNMETTKRHEPMTLFKRYTPAEYTTYTNYPAIEVPKVAEIPMDYPGEMGVPITFLDKYNPDQFQIVGISTQLAEPMARYASKENYMSKSGNVVGGSGKLFLPLGNGKHEGVYERIIIKHISATK